MNTSSSIPSLADSEIVIGSGALKAAVSPYGASLRGVWIENGSEPNREIVTRYSGAAAKVGGQGDVLIPFPGRVKDGRYRFEGSSYQLAVNDKDGPNAIHGFMRTLVWSVAQQDSDRVTFSCTLEPHEGYPFQLHTTVGYSISEFAGEQGMECRYIITNVGTIPAPVAAGFHPYFSAGGSLIDACELELPMRGVLEFENLIPTGRVLPVEDTEFNFLTTRSISDVKFNTCFVDPVRAPDERLLIRFKLPEGHTTTVWMDGAINYVVLYSGDPLPESHRRRSLAIEPMSCGSDGFNHPEWGLESLAPGETMTGSWGVETS